MKKTAVIGGGAAGFFLAVNLKEMMPQMDVTIFERGKRVLHKVEVSGGGRCNCTNTFAHVADLSQVYPRGHRLLKRLFHVFSHEDAYRWFETHGVPLTAQADGCVFPLQQDSRVVIDCLLNHARRYGVKIHTDHAIDALSDVSGYDYVAVTTGGTQRHDALQWLGDAGHETVQPLPSLFSFSIDSTALHALQGLVAEQATVYIPGTKLRASGPLLITHWGLSGPAVLRLSSYAARHLAECDYHAPLGISWLTMTEADTLQLIRQTACQQPNKLLTTANPFGLPQRLWAFLAEEAINGRTEPRWGELGRKDHNRLANTINNYTCNISGRAPFKDEFVTCGGIALESVNPATLESRKQPNLYFAGEVLDIDGITGGFNFQAAWTTAYTVAKSIKEKSLSNG